MSDQHVSLRQAESYLREQGYKITYWQLWDRAERGLIPVQMVAGRRLLRRDDLPRVAAAFAPSDQ